MSRKRSLTTRENTVTGMPIEEARRRANAISAVSPDEVIAIKCSRDWPTDYRMQQFCKGQQSAGLRALDEPIPGTSPEIAASIRVKCAREWPDDYRMRAFCQTQQDPGGSTPQPSQSPGGFNAFNAAEAATMRAKCAKEWPNDARMRAFCQTQQERGALAIRRPVPGGGSDSSTIRSTCARQWPDDFRMRAFCEERQVDGLRRVGR